MLIAVATFWLGVYAVPRAAHERLAIEASVWGGPVPVGGWSLRIDDDGRATLGLAASAVAGTTGQQRAFSIGAAPMAALRQEIGASGLMPVPSDQREHMGEGFQVCELSVRIGERATRVFLASARDDPVAADRAEVVRRAVRVWKAVKVAAEIQNLHDPCSALSTKAP